MPETLLASSPASDAASAFSSPKGSLDVYSCGTRISPHVIDACRRIDHVFAADKLLAFLQGGSPVCHNLSPSPRKALLKAMELADQGARVALLSTGDALYHGLGSTLLDVLGKAFPDFRTGNTGFNLPFALTFHPGITAFQALCHKVGIAWSEARLFSAHHSFLQPLRVLRARTAIIYAGLPLTAPRIAGKLCEADPSSSARACVLAENIDTDNERIVSCTLGEACDLAMGPTSILVLLPKGAHAPVLPLGLADEHFHFENHCLTNRYVRPVVLSCLRLPCRGVLWDLGAGSGSVGLEAALLQPDLAVCAVEKFPERCANIEANAKRLGVPNLALTRGDILKAMPTLPNPARIFVGGGGKDLARILDLGLARLDADDPDARLVVTAITMETVAMLTQYTGGVCMEALSLDIAVRADMVAGRYSHLAPLNRIHIFSFRPRV